MQRGAYEQTKKLFTEIKKNINKKEKKQKQITETP